MEARKKRRCRRTFLSPLQPVPFFSFFHRVVFLLDTSRYYFLLLRFERRGATTPSLFLSSSLLLGFHRVFSLFLIDRWRERESPRESLSGHFHVRWITRSPKSDRLTKCQWGRTIVERISLVANLILRIESNFHGSVTRAWWKYNGEGGVFIGASYRLFCRKNKITGIVLIPYALRSRITRDSIMPFLILLIGVSASNLHLSYNSCMQFGGILGRIYQICFILYFLPCDTFVLTI